MINLIQRCGYESRTLTYRTTRYFTLWLNFEVVLITYVPGIFHFLNKKKTPYKPAPSSFVDRIILALFYYQSWIWNDLDSTVSK
jgi:hypothetical protein